MDLADRLIERWNDEFPGRLALGRELVRRYGHITRVYHDLRHLDSVLTHIDLLAGEAKDARLAIKLFTEANGLLDTWLGHFDLGRAYLEAGAPLQADSEFDRCLKRRGEALALFLDEEPTYAYFPPVYYYQGRVREALNATGFANSYRAYLAIRGNSKEDPLLPEVHKRAGQS